MCVCITISLYAIASHSYTSRDPIIHSKAENNQGYFRKIVTLLCTFHTLPTVGLMLTCKFISSAKQNRTFFPPFLLKTKSLSGIWQ